MKTLSVIVILIVAGYSQMNWDIEIIDSMVFTGNEFNYTHSSLALDNNEIPHVVYNKFDKIIYASKTDTIWQRELVDSSLFYACFSLLFDEDNIAHLSYYRKDDVLNMTYLCYARRDTSGWTIGIVDSIYGIISDYWFLWGYYKTSLVLDASNLPGIAYTSWNFIDSLHYIKYAHFNGVIWNTSVVEYDSVWSSHTVPSDWSPNLKFNNESVPIIAFHQIYGNPQDTIKIAHFDDTLNQWIIDPAICDPYGGASISLILDSQNNPCIAHGMGTALVYSWRDSVSWYTEFTGDDIGWLNIRIALDLDSSDNPHIFYHPTGPVHYCYRDSIWCLCGRVDSTLDNLGDISLDLDGVDEPHVCFRFYDWDSAGQVNIYGIKYGKGIFTGVKEKQITLRPNTAFICSPSVVRTVAEIKFNVFQKVNISLDLYNNIGRLVQNIYAGERAPGTYFQKVSLKNLPCGVYHLLLRMPHGATTRKIVKIE